MTMLTGAIKVRRKRKLRYSRGSIARWLRQGQRPDYRFSLANERTFLAWIRTALALIAGAIGIDQFASGLGGPWLRGLMALALLTAAATLAGTAFRHWALTERAMRHDADMPPPNLFLGISVFVAVLVAALVPMLLWAQR